MNINYKAFEFSSCPFNIPFCICMQPIFDFSAWSIERQLAGWHPPRIVNDSCQTIGRSRGRVMRPQMNAAIPMMPMMPTIPCCV